MTVDASFWGRTNYVRGTFTYTESTFAASRIVAAG